MATRIQLRRDASAQWTANNPTLSAGELGYETDTKKIKIGTGSDAWNSLSYVQIALGTDTTGNYVATISGTSNQISVSGSGSESSTVTLSLPQDINTTSSPTFAGATLDAVRVGITGSNEIDTASGNLTIDSAGGTVTVDDNLVVSGNLTVSGTTTTVNTEEINLADNIIVLNANATGAPTENAGIEIERGDSANVVLRWNESLDTWEATRNGTDYYALVLAGDDISTSDITNFTEDVQDIVGGMVSTNTESGISVTYDDANGKLNFDVNDPTITLSGDVTGTATMTNLGNVSISTTIAANSVELGTDTTGNYVASVSGTDGVSVSGTGESAAVTIANTDKGSSQNIFKNVAVSGQSTIVADTNDDTLTIASGTGITLTTNATTDTLTVTNAGVTSVNGSTGAITNVALTTGKLSQFAATTSAELLGVISDETGTGSLVFSASPTFSGTVSAANLTLSGDLTVNGTTTTINSTTLSVDDKNIELGSVATPTDTTADGGGITLKGATDKTFNWVDSTDAWTSSEHLNLLTGKSFYINGTSVLSSTALGSGVTSSSLTSVGTIGTGVWQGSEISTTYTAAKVTSVNGSTGAVTGLATTAGKLSQFAATTSSELAGVISDETGTGALVFAASPTLSGTPAAPTASADTNTTQIATTAFVVGQAGSATPLVNGTAAIGTSLRYARQDHVHGTDTTRAPLASPTFTGTVTAATLSLTTADTATTASHYFVETASDGVIRPKTLANVRTEVVTTAAVNSAAATTVGTITSGTWEATDVGLSHGGTGATLSAVNGGVVYSTASAMAITSAGTAGQVLTSNGASAPTWQSVSAGFDGFLLAGM